MFVVCFATYWERTETFMMCSFNSQTILQCFLCVVTAGRIKGWYYTQINCQLNGPKKITHHDFILFFMSLRTLTHQLTYGWIKDWNHPNILQQLNIYIFCTSKDLENIKTKSWPPAALTLALERPFWFSSGADINKLDLERNNQGHPVNLNWIYR